MPPSAITGMSAFLRRLDRIHDRGELRHADAGDDARGADRARADADLDRVRAGIDQRLRAFGGRDVAGHHLHLVGQPLDAVDGVEHVLRMAVRGVDDDEIDAGLDQPLGAVEALVADRGRGGDAQAALLVLAGVRIGDRLLDVLHGDQADAAILRRRPPAASRCGADAAAAWPRPGSTPSRTVISPSLVISSATRLPRIGGEAHVAVGEDADELAGLAVAAALDHRNAGDAVAPSSARARRRASRRAGW